MTTEAQQGLPVVVAIWRRIRAMWPKSLATLLEEGIAELDALAHQARDERDAALSRIQALEQELQTERCLSFRSQVHELEQDIEAREEELRVFRGVYANLQASANELLERLLQLRADAHRALEAWDNTVLPKSHDGMMQERMECLRAAISKEGA